MQLTITTSSGQIINLDVSEDLELENLKAQCEFELGVPSSNLVLVWNGRPLRDDKKNLQAYGIKNGDVLLVQQVTQPLTAPNTGAHPGGMRRVKIEFQNVPVLKYLKAPIVPVYNLFN